MRQNRYPYPQAAGAKGGPAIRLPGHFVFPPKTVITDHEQHLCINILRDYEALGVYHMLLAQCDFETGQGTTHYQTLESGGLQPKPERGGRRRRSVTRDVLRRILADLESVDLVRRDLQGNAAQGELRFVLPYRAYLASEWKKTLAERNKAQRLAHVKKPAQPA